MAALPDAVPFSKGRLAYVMVEAYQNIVRHQAKGVDPGSWGDGRSAFMLRCGPKAQRVLAQNAVATTKVTGLEERLGRLAAKDAAALKELFMQNIQQDNAPGVRGAGLGLIEMVRRSGGRVTWTFRPINAEITRFTIGLDVGGAAGGGPAKEEDEPLRDLLMAQRAELCFVGPWSPAIQAVLLDLLGAGPGMDGGLAAAMARIGAPPRVFLLRQAGAGGSLLLGGSQVQDLATAMAGQERGAGDALHVLPMEDAPGILVWTGIS